MVCGRRGAGLVLEEGAVVEGDLSVHEEALEEREAPRLQPVHPVQDRAAGRRLVGGISRWMPRVSKGWFRERLPN